MYCNDYLVLYDVCKKNIYNIIMGISFCVKCLYLAVLIYS